MKISVSFECCVVVTCKSFSFSVNIENTEIWRRLAEACKKCTNEVYNDVGLSGAVIEVKNQCVTIYVQCGRGSKLSINLTIQKGLKMFDMIARKIEEEDFDSDA